MKILAGILAFLFCFFAGLSASYKLNKRKELLTELKVMLKDFEISMMYTAPPLLELMEHGNGLFSELLRNFLPEYSDLKAAWDKAADALSGKPQCGKEEILLLKELGEQLGTTPVEGQLSLLRLYYERMDVLLKSAEEECARKGKMFRSVGALIGIGAAILIL